MNAKEEKVCPECGKHFKPMTERQWNLIYFEHRLASKKHASFRTAEYVERINREYEARRVVLA